MVPGNENISFLVGQLREGSEAAFTRLYDLYSKQLYRNLLRLVRDEAVAEELLQDLFLKVWEGRGRLDAEKSFKSFLYKVGENLVYGHFRKVAKDNRLMTKLAVAYVDRDTNAEEVMIGGEERALLHRAIAQLPPQRRQVYVLCKLEGKSYEEVGEELGISTSTVRNQIVKANKAVKSYFVLNQDIAMVLVIARLLKHLF